MRRRRVLKKEFLGKMYACIFCDSVKARLESDPTNSELEEAYLKHLKRNHGLEP